MFTVSTLKGVSIMHTTIIYESDNDSILSSPINTALKKHFSTSQFTLLEINKDATKPCIGCFGCWTKTPGKCVIKNDIVSQTNPSFVQSDYVILVSNIHYGCYSAATKRIIDRFIPNILPFFRKYKNEMHHETRYKHLASQIIIAYNEDLLPEEKTTFIKLTKANATNQGVNDPQVFFCSNKDDIEPILDSIKKQISVH